MRGSRVCLWALLFSALWTGPVFGHGGGLDDYGGHHNRKQGAYHFHRGPLAGRVFPGKAEAMDALKRYAEKTALARRQAQLQETPPLRQADVAEQNSDAGQALPQPQAGGQ